MRLKPAANVVHHHPKLAMVVLGMLTAPLQCYNKSSRQQQIKPLQHAHTSTSSTKIKAFTKHTIVIYNVFFFSPVLGARNGSHSCSFHVDTLGRCDERDGSNNIYYNMCIHILPYILILNLVDV